MSSLKRGDGIAGAVALTIALIAGAMDLAEYGGAHPFWSSSVVYIGAPLGIILAAIVRRVGLGRTGRLILYILLLGIAVWVAQTGKARFAASFAEDAFGGKMWYYGWIATATFGTALLARLLSRG